MIVKYYQHLIKPLMQIKKIPEKSILDGSKRVLFLSLEMSQKLKINSGLTDSGGAAASTAMETLRRWLDDRFTRWQQSP